MVWWGRGELIVSCIIKITIKRLAIKKCARPTGYNKSPERIKRSNPLIIVLSYKHNIFLRMTFPLKKKKPSTQSV